MILAALSAKTTSLQSAAVLALCRLMYVSQRNQWCHSAQQLISMHINANASTVMITYTPMYLIQCLRTILLLMTSSAREVLQAVIGYVRVAILAIPTSALTEFGLVKDIIVALNAHTNSLALRYRNKIKIIIRVLLRKIGVQEMTNVLHELNDDSSKNKNYGRLMTHVMKLARREARKKANQQHADDTNDMEFDELMEGEEDDSLMGRTLLSGMDMTHRTKLTRYPSNVSKIDHDTIASRTMNNTLSSSRKKMRSSVNQQQILLVEQNDGIADNFDMLNEEKMQRMVRFVDDDKRRGYMDDDSDDDGGALEFDADGRLLIPNDDDFSVDNDVNNYGDDDHAMNDNATYKSSKSMKSNASSRSKKGKQLENHTNSNKRMSKLEQTRQRMQEQHQKKNASNNNNKQLKKSQLGAAYKSSKAGGDVKRKNQKYEPYAFVPLDGRTYTKKHRAGAVQQMEGVVRQRKGSVKRKRS
jgi:ribosomal RNA-processing protein 12